MLTQQLAKIQAAWDKIAEGYDTYVTPAHDSDLPKKALRHGGLRPGMKFLDVASGSGTLSLPAAQLGAEVVAVDLSPTMIRLLKNRSQAEGLLNLEGKVMDGHALEFGDNTFDIAGSQFGVMLFPDLSRGILEMVRVIRSRGSVLLITFGSPANVEFLIYFLKAIKTVVPGFTGLQTNPPPLPFQVSAPEVLRQKMEEAGLIDISIEQDIEHLKFHSGKDMWNWVTNSNPIAADMVAPLSEEQKIEVQQHLDKMLRANFGQEGYAILKSPVNIATGKK